MSAWMATTHTSVPDAARRMNRVAYLAALALAAWHAAATPAEPHTEASQDVTQSTDAAMHAVLDGRDARAAVAEALALHASSGKTSAVVAHPVSTAMGAYAQSVDRIHSALSAEKHAWSPATTAAARDRLASAVDELRAQRWLVDGRIAQIDRIVGADSMPSIARTRWQERRAALVTRIELMDEASKRLADAIEATPSRASLPSQQLEVLVADEVRSAAPPILGASTLPVFRPRLAVRDPVMTPVVTPSYANAEVEDSPVAADHAVNEDTPLSAAIVDQAESLGRDYTRILDFVRSQVRTQWYAGAQKGAEATLRTRSGNDVDQASLLIALLRASGAPARYVRGVVEIPVVDLAAMLGVRAADVGRALAAAGVANRPVVAGGQVNAFMIEHVFVSAWLPFANYRGTAADLDGRTWIPLAPAIKRHAFVAAQDILQRAGVVTGTFIDQFLSGPQTIAPLAQLRERITDALAQQSPPVELADLIARHDVDAAPIGLLPASLPVPVRAVTGEFAELPDALRQHARIVVRSGLDDAAPVVFDHRLPVSRLIDRRVTISYQPASIDDGRIADLYGGLGGTPPYLIHLRAVLNVAGLPVAAGEGELEGGGAHRVDVTMDSPAGVVSMSQQLLAGGIAALVLDGQADAPLAQPDDLILPGESETKAARVLWNFGARYLTSWDTADEELADLAGASILRPFPSIALVMNQYRVDRVGGLADRMVWKGVALDAALRPVEPMPHDGRPETASNWLSLSALQGSYLEHALFEQQWAVESVSAGKGLAIARDQGIPVLALTQASGTGELRQPQPVIDAIETWLARGFVVDAPRDPITHEAWSGAVWRVRSLPTGEAGYFISGHLAGGSTALPPELWYFQDLVEWLSSVYGQAPSEDPLSGAVLAIDESAQYQDGIVDTELEQPLRAFLRDAAGRPVKDAIVTFSVVQGNGRLLDADNVERAQVSYTTNSAGVATARFRMGKLQETLGHYRTIPDKPWPQWVGINTVEVRADAALGPLYSGEPYFAYSWPQAPSELLLAGLDGAILNPGLGYTTHLATVEDVFGNVISNADVTLSATTEYEDNTCFLGDPVDPIPATLFAPGHCPEGELLLTGNSCATPTLMVTTRPGGAPFFVVPPEAALASVTIDGASAGATATLALATNPIYDPCRGGDITGMIAWTRTPTFGLVPMFGEYSPPIDAAAPNHPMPVPQRMDAYVARTEITDTTDLQWHPVTDATFEAHLQNGSLDTVQNIGAGRYLLTLRAGPVAGPVHGEIFWQSTLLALSGSTRSLGNGTNGLDPSDLTYAWSVDMRPPRVSPANIELTPFGVTDSAILIEANALPADYVAAPARIDLLLDGEVVRECTAAYMDLGRLSCAIPRGMQIEPGKSYSARVILNDGTPFRLESAETELEFGQGIVAGFGMLPRTGTGGTQPPEPGAGVGVDPVLLVQGRYPKQLSLRDFVDIPSGYACPSGATFNYLLSQDASVSLTFHRLDEQGNPSPVVAWSALDDVASEAGLHDVEITSADLPIGDYAYVLHATAEDGAVEEYEGVATHRVDRRDSLPLAHTFVKGVDLHSGGAVISETDIEVGGRGPGMRLTRTYASHQGDQRGYFGRGWSSDLDAHVVVDDCDTRIVTGSAGQGQRFAPAGTEADGARRFTPLHGYHGVLVQRDGAYDFHAKDGTRHHFAQVDGGFTRLSYVEDTNGNRVAYTYESDQGVARVKRLEDGSGRSIDLAYAVRHVQTEQAGYTIQGSFTIVTEARGPGGLSIRYEFDEAGNLVRTIRQDDSQRGRREQAYEYTDLRGVWASDPAGEPMYFHFGHRLTAVVDAITEARRTYDYSLGWSGIDTSDGILYLPEQRASTVTEPDLAVTRFTYPEVRGLSDVTTDVIDAREHSTHYGLNRYGAATRVQDPAGTTLTEWDFEHLQPRMVTDAIGTTTSYAYDDSGNMTSESITHPTGASITHSFTYRQASDFTVPFIRNRIDTATDGNSHATTYGYDARGNRTSTTRGGITEHDAYASNGDHASHTNGAGQVWLLRHDSHGYLRETVDPLHHASSSEFDVRGRKTSEMDANGNATTFAYDARDRLLSTTYPRTSPDAPEAIQSSAYDDAAGTRLDTDPDGQATMSTFDKMGRLIKVTRVTGHDRRFQHDANGNLLVEEDFADPPNVTRHTYDDANRRITTEEPEGRTTLRTFDALGHVISETVGEGADASGDARESVYAYDHPLYRLTRMTRRVNATTFAVEEYEYDNEGNLIGKRDAEDRETAFSYDARNRLVAEAAPLGRNTIMEFDGADRVIRQILRNPGFPDQVRTREYDPAGRLSVTTDAMGGRRTFSHDAKGNALSRSDARGNLTWMTYDARDRLVSEIGPAEGQVTNYEWTLAGKQKSETWANGNVRRTSYDMLGRKSQTVDDEGVVEAFTYTANDEIETRRDANGHVTRNGYDGLRRLVRQELPTISGAERVLRKRYNVHGDLESETDPQGHVTTHDHDGLGRRISTTMPDVQNPGASLAFGYDLVGNLASQTDARGNETRFTYDALNRRTRQDDPPTLDGTWSQTWTWDAAGNELTHVDRRGVTTVTAYDLENRPITITRDGLVVSRRSYDKDGRVETDTDALGRITTNTHDAAGRLTREDRPLEHQRSWTWWPMGDVHTATDADGRTVTSTWTKRRFLASETNYAGETTVYGYDGEGHRTSMRRPLDGVWSYAYDEGDRLIAITDPVGGAAVPAQATTYAYDRDGNRTSQTDANGHTTSFAYDARHRLVQLSWPATAEGTAVASWTHDPDGNVLSSTTPNGNVLSHATDALNRVVGVSVGTSVAEEVASTAWHYDGNGNVTAIDETLGNGALRHATRSYDAFDRLDRDRDAYGRELAYQYDAVGNRTHLIDADRQTTIWSYDALNRVGAMTVPGQGTTVFESYPSGKPRLLTRPDGSTSATAYDDAGRIASIIHAKAGVVIAELAYVYDANGNRIDQRERNGAVTGDVEQVTTYAYDEADRLTSVHAPDRDVTYTLDAVGNRLTEQVRMSGVLVSESTLTYNARDQLVERDDPVRGLLVELAYDANGNVRTQTDASGTRAFTYDARDRLLTLAQPNAPPLVFDYQSDGQRLAKRQAGSETRDPAPASRTPG